MGATGQPNQSGQSGKHAGFPRRFGKYTLLSHLATGGMADVFLARQLGPAGFQKECVIKRILPNLAQDPYNQSFIDMFLDEARIAARLSHPNIVHIFDLGQVGGDYFLALEYVDGITIENLLDIAREAGHSALPWPIAVRIVSNVAEGLEHAHKAKDGSGDPLLLVHRDISPSNIMVSWDGVAKVLDFGIAKAMAASVVKAKTGAGIIKGKVPYMSPEQIQGLDLDGRSDIFSLGVVLYEMTTGQRPFPGETTGQLTVQITSREPQPPETLNPAFPRDLWPLLMRAMAKSANSRYQSARDFKLDLEQFLSDQLVSCTNYDVEAYLRELVPNRPRLELPTAEEIARVESEAQESAEGMPAAPVLAASAPSSTSAGSGSLSHQAFSAQPQDLLRRRDGSSGPGIDVLEAENAAEQRRHRQGGSSGVIMGAIALLVLGTAVIFYLLHERAVNQSGPVLPPTTESSPPAAPPIGTTPTPPAAAVPAAPPSAAPAPNAEPAAASDDKKAAPAKPEQAEKAEKPDKVEKAEKTDKVEKPEPAEKATEPAEEKPKPKPKRIKKQSDEDAAPDVSKLPLPPPPPPEP